MCVETDDDLYVFLFSSRQLSVTLSHFVSCALQLSSHPLCSLFFPYQDIPEYTIALVLLIVNYDALLL